MNPQTSRSVTEIIQQVCYTYGAHDLPGGTWRFRIIHWRLMTKSVKKSKGISRIWTAWKSKKLSTLSHKTKSFAARRAHTVCRYLGSVNREAPLDGLSNTATWQESRIAKQIEILINYKRICHSHKASSRPLCELCLMKNTLQLFPGDE